MSLCSPSTLSNKHINYSEKEKKKHRSTKYWPRSQFPSGPRFTSGLPHRVCIPWLGIVVALYEFMPIIHNLILVLSSLDSFSHVLWPDLLHEPVYLQDCRILPLIGHPTSDWVTIIDLRGIFLEGRQSADPPFDMFDNPSCITLSTY